MDETDGWLIIACLFTIGIGHVLLSRRVRAMAEEVDFLRAYVRQADTARAD